jgi:hypothetical protein
MHNDGDTDFKLCDVNSVYLITVTLNGKQNYLLRSGATGLVSYSCPRIKKICGVLNLEALVAKTTAEGGREAKYQCR